MRCEAKAQSTAGQPAQAAAGVAGAGIPAIEAAGAAAHDATTYRTGALDVLAQHVWGMACSGPIRPGNLYR